MEGGADKKPIKKKYNLDFNVKNIEGQIRDEETNPFLEEAEVKPEIKLPVEDEILDIDNQPKPKQDQVSPSHKEEQDASMGGNLKQPKNKIGPKDGENYVEVIKGETT